VPGGAPATFGSVPRVSSGAVTVTQSRSLVKSLSLVSQSNSDMSVMLALACVLLAGPAAPGRAAGAVSPALAPAAGASPRTPVGYGFLTGKLSKSFQGACSAPADPLSTAACSAGKNGTHDALRRRAEPLLVSTDHPGHHDPLRQPADLHDSVTTISLLHTSTGQETTGNSPPLPSSWWLREFATYLGLTGRSSNSTDPIGGAILLHLYWQATVLIPFVAPFLACSHIVALAFLADASAAPHRQLNASFDPLPIAPHRLALAWPLHWATITAALSPMGSVAVFFYFTLWVNSPELRAAPDYAIHGTCVTLAALATLVAIPITLAFDFAFAPLTHLALLAVHLGMGTTCFAFLLTTRLGAWFHASKARPPPTSAAPVLPVAPSPDSGNPRPEPPPEPPVGPPPEPPVASTRWADYADDDELPPLPLSWSSSPSSSSADSDTVPVASGISPDEDAPAPPAFSAQEINSSPSEPYSPLRRRTLSRDRTIAVMTFVYETRREFADENCAYLRAVAQYCDAAAVTIQARARGKISRVRTQHITPAIACPDCDHIDAHSTGGYDGDCSDNDSPPPPTDDCECLGCTHGLRDDAFDTCTWPSDLPPSPFSSQELSAPPSASATAPAPRLTVIPWCATAAQLLAGSFFLLLATHAFLRHHRRLYSQPTYRLRFLSTWLRVVAFPLWATWRVALPGAPPCPVGHPLLSARYRVFRPVS
jgi:hypothetical protein